MIPDTKIESTSILSSIQIQGKQLLNHSSTVPHVIQMVDHDKHLDVILTSILLRIQFVNVIILPFHSRNLNKIREQGNFWVPWYWTSLFLSQKYKCVYDCMFIVLGNWNRALLYKKSSYTKPKHSVEHLYISFCASIMLK